uniref:Uncharacterized protein n=1 Tax=Solanum lycopersicum TaxID=4081 RepID=A0A3Q7EVA4_SOLLC
MWDGHNSFITSPIFSSISKNIVVQKLKLTNSYNYPPVNSKIQ